jgi:hypothetical protein
VVNPANSFGASQYPTVPGQAATDQQLTNQLSRDTTQQLQVPQGPADFDHWTAAGNLAKGATVGFVGNTLGAVANNPLLAAGAIALGVLVPPAGVAMAGAGLIGAGLGAWKSFAKSKQLADQADQLKQTDPYNMQQAAVLYRQAEDQYNDIGSNTTGAVTSALSLGWLARGSGARAVTRGDMTPEQLATITEQKGFLGNNAQTLKENWRDKASVKPDAPDAAAAQPPASQPAAQPASSPSAASSPTTVHRYLQKNRHAQTMLETMQRQTAQLDKALKTLDSGRGNLIKANQQARDAAHDLQKYSKALKQAAAEGHFTEDLPPALSQAMDNNVAKVQAAQTRLGQLDELNMLRQSNPQLDKLLREVSVFENGRGSKLQNLLAKNGTKLEKRGNWASELRQASEGYRQQLEQILNTQPDLGPAAQQALSQKVDQLGQLAHANQTLDDMIWLEAMPERAQAKFATTRAQRNDTGFTPFTDAQIEQSPWSALGFEMDRLRKLNQQMQGSRLNSSKHAVLQQAVEASRQQALNIIDHGLLPNASSNNQQMQLLNHLRQGVAQDPGVRFLQQPLSSPASTANIPLPQQAVQQAGQKVQNARQQAHQGVNALISDPAARQSAFQAAVIGGNLAYANKGWLNPTLDVTQPQQQTNGAGQPGQPGQQTPTFGSNNSTSEPVGDYGSYVVLNMGRSNFRINKAPRPNKVSQENYDKLTLAEKPYYIVDNGMSQSTASPSTPQTSNSQPQTSSRQNQSSVSQTWWRS